MTVTPNAVLMTDTRMTGRAYPRKCDLPEINRDAMKRSRFNFLLRQLKYAKFACVFVLLFTFCQPVAAQLNIQYNKKIETGADQTKQWIPLLKGKTVALCGNQTSILSNGRHLADTLMALKINLKKLFTPEHGLRGQASAGEKVGNSTDASTGLPVISLYGKNKKPAPADLKGIDVMVFDLQDVGARFYTYISTLHYLMEACAENKIELLVMDRPNPNGFYVDGPVLSDTALRSFVGMHPIPIVHGMTIGEYAQMINGEGWLKGKVKCKLSIINCVNYTHKDYYELPVAPSPNLTTMQAIYYYPTTCLLEGTCISVGRGTSQPFRNLGMPGFKTGKNYFTPKSNAGAKSPTYENEACRGIFVSDSMVNSLLRKPKIDLELLTFFKQNAADDQSFITPKGSFDILAGTKQLKAQLSKGLEVEVIRTRWQPGLAKFKQTRKKYLLYPDYE